jgi:hypothetical protein
MCINTSFVLSKETKVTVFWNVTPQHLRTAIADELASVIVTVYKQRIIFTFYSDSSFHSHAPEDTKFSQIREVTIHRRNYMIEQQDYKSL